MGIRACANEEDDDEEERLEVEYRGLSQRKGKLADGRAPGRMTGDVGIICYHAFLTEASALFDISEIVPVAC